MTPSRPRFGVLLSGSGTNLQAIIDASESGALAADVAVVISNSGSAYGLTRACEHSIPAVHVDRAAYASPAEHNAAIRDELLSHSVDWVVMAGYMRLLGAEVLDAFPNRVLNIHPALLPSFPGAHGIADAFAFGVKVTGVTVHFANEVFDDGPIIAQRPIEIAEDDTLETLEAKIHAAEHELYPRVLQLIAKDRVEIVGRKVRIKPAR
ncbi:MAG: phosphoribosylglycinamide formyltransferase [Coriobacteriia bacterium]|nr:phosphoribosylglycinamide formyltransferase [Coriobacteriia bacterium]